MDFWELVEDNDDPDKRIYKLSNLLYLLKFPNATRNWKTITCINVLY